MKQIIEKKLAEGIPAHRKESTLGRERNRLYSEAAKLRKSLDAFAEEIRRWAESTDDKEHAKELQSKASVLTTGMRKLSDLEEMLGSLKLGKGRF